jgi:hypothetical protein
MSKLKISDQRIIKMCLLVLNVPRISVGPASTHFDPPYSENMVETKIIIAALSEFRDSLRRRIKKSLLSKDKLLVFLCFL